MGNSWFAMFAVIGLVAVLVLAGIIVSEAG